jgi:hypothetical protein
MLSFTGVLWFRLKQPDDYNHNVDDDHNYNYNPSSYSFDLLVKCAWPVSWGLF